MKDKRTYLYLALILLILSLPWSAAAQEAADLSFEVEVGFDGYIKTNAWTPIRITASNVGADIEGEVRLRSDFPGETYASSLSLPSGSQKEILLFMPLHSNTFSFEFASNNEVLYRSDETVRLIPSLGFLVGVVATDPDLLNFLAGLQTSSGDALSVAHLALADLPAASEGLSSLDAMIFDDIDTSQLAPDQRQALRSWVMAGGRLIVSGGPNASATISGLVDLLPLDGVSLETVESLSGLADYVSEPVAVPGPFLVAIPQNTTGSIYIEQAGAPLLVYNPLSQGSVTYFALGFELAPMNGWAGNTAFWEHLLTPLEGKLPFYTTFDAMRSINNALANINVATMPAPVSLAVFLCVYILALVPINYFVLRWLKRRELAWVTIPALILLFTIGGYVAGFRARGGRALLRQVSVIQQTNGAAGSAVNPTAPVDTFVGLYSPARERYTLRFKDKFLVQPTNNGSGYEGVKTTASAPTTIYFGPQTELQNLWTDVGGMATVVAHGQTQPQPITLDLEIGPQGNNYRIFGTIENKTGEALNDAFLLVGDFGVRLSKLEPGRVEINQPLQPLEVGQTYSDQTIWGEFYYQLSEPVAILNDQIIRSIFWPSELTLNQQPGPMASQLGNEVILLGWQAKTPAEMEIEIVGRRFDRETFNLLIVRSGYALGESSGLESEDQSAKMRD